MTELRSATCHMGSHGVTCHPTQVSAPHLNPSHAGGGGTRSFNVTCATDLFAVHGTIIITDLLIYTRTSQGLHFTVYAQILAKY